MPTEVAVVDSANPDSSILHRAAEVICRGGLVAFPTETVYGLGADATNAEAVARVFNAKGRPATNPLIVHVHSAEAAKGCASEWPGAADLLASAFWPGSLTIVVPAAPIIAPIVLAGGSTVGLRVPSNAVALSLLRACNRPIAAPSANRSESLSPTTAEHVLRGLDGRIDLILDGDPTTGGLESTVVDLSVSPPRLLRPGLVSAERLRVLLPDLEIAPNVDASRIQKSPGRSPRHYATATPMELVADVAAMTSKPSGRVAVVAFGDFRIPIADDRVVRRNLPANAQQAARELYSLLHELDQLGLDRILVQEPPAGDDWSAVRDRLQRASTR